MNIDKIFESDKDKEIAFLKNKLFNLENEIKGINNPYIKNDYYRTIIKSIGDAIIITNINGEITEMNRVGEQLTGWTLQEVLGRRLDDVFKIINEETRLTVKSPFEEVIKKGIAVGLTNHTILISKHGMEIPISDSGSPIINSNGDIIGVVIVFRNQSDERRAQKIMDVRIKLLDFADDHSINEILVKTLDEIEKLTNSRIGFFHYVNDDQETLSLQAWSTQAINNFRKAEGSGLHYKISQAGIWADAIRQRKPIVHNNYNELPNKKGMPEGHAYVERELVVPIIKNGKIVSILGVGNKIIDYDHLDVELVSYVADICWTIVEKKQLELSSKNKELIINAMGEAAQVGGWEFDVESGLGSWTLETAHIHGLEMNTEPSADLGLSFYLPDSRLIIEKAVKEAIEYGKSYDLVLEMVDKKGFKKWVRTIGNPVYENKKITKLRGSIQDVTNFVKQKEALIKSEEDLNITLNSIGDAVIVTDTKGKIIRLNPIAEQLTGFLIDEVRNMHIDSVFRIFNAQTGEMAINPIDRVLKEGVVVGLANHTKLISKTGQEIHISDSAAPIRNSKGEITGLILVFRDVSNDYILRENLVQSELRYKSVFENTGTATTILESDGLISLANSKFTELSGYSLDEIIGKKTWMDFVVSDDLPRMVEQHNLRRVDRNKALNEYEFRFRRANGEIRYINLFVDILPESSQSIASLIDVTNRKLAEIAILENENQLRKSFHIGKMGSWKLDLNKHLMYVSEESAQIYGVDFQDSFLPDEVQSLHLPEYRDFLSESLNNLITAQVKYDVEFKLKRQNDGEIVVIHAMAEYYPNENVVLGVIQDITENKKVELAILESEYRFRSYVENANDIIYAVSPSGIFTYMSPKWEEFMGSPAEELIGKSIEDFVHPDDVSICRDFLVKVLTTKEKQKSIEYRVRHLDGSWRWQVSNGATLCDNQGNTCEYFGIARDVTEARQTTEALKESEEKFRNLFQTHSAIKLIIDGETANIVEANEAAVQFYGWSVEELKKKKMSQINVMPASEFKKAFEKAVHNENNHFDFQHYKADGTICEVEVFASKLLINGRPFIHSIIHDVSQKKINEQRLKLLSRSVEQNPITIVITDASGSIEYVNPAFTKITGYTLEEALGQNPRVLNSGFHSKEFFTSLWETILSGKDWVGELLNKNKNGDLYWENAIISPIYNDVGVITHFVAVKEDISKQKKLIADLTLAKEKAEEADRLKSAFLANMSHEIRTPMNGILGFTGLLKSPDLSVEEQEQFIDIIQKSGQRMLSTVNDLIDISKIETGQMQLILLPINFNESVQYQFEFFMQEAKTKNLELILINNISKSEANIITDPVKLDSIFTNLIKNAIKFTDKGSIEIGCSRFGNEIHVYVKDTGIGVPLDRQKAIFNRFEQADIADVRAFQGSGLGLAITKAYVKMLGGEIEVESEFGKGSNFKFFIKASIDSSKTNSENEQNILKENVDKNNKCVKILIAEDDDTGFYFLQTLLKSHDCEIIRAYNGLEVVELFKNNRDVDLILMDMKMPELNGYLATEQIRKMDKDVIIIAQTAYAMAGDFQKAIDSGCDDYISKPIVKKDFFDKIGQYLKITKKIN